MTKYKKVLFIFLFAFLLSIIIYKLTYKKEVNVLSIGDYLALGRVPYDTQNWGYDYYLKNNLDVNYNNNISKMYITYKDIYNTIYYDKLIYDKGKYKNIKNVISNADYIILNANNRKTYKKCSKNERIFTEYLDYTFEDITKIVDIIKKINNNSKLIVLTPYCNTFSDNINEYIIKYYNYKDVNFINLYEGLNSNKNYIINKNSMYPSSKGQYYIYNEIFKMIKNN